MTETIFTVYNPRARDPESEASTDWTALQRAGAVRFWRGADGVLRGRFARPFRDLKLFDREELSVWKNARLRAARQYFGAPTWREGR